MTCNHFFQFILLFILTVDFIFPTHAETHWPVAELLTKPLNDSIRAEVPSSMAEFSGVTVETTAMKDGRPHVVACWLERWKVMF